MQKRNLYLLEKRLTEAKTRYDVYIKTLCMQGSFTEKQRETLADLKVKRDLLQMDLDKFKFEEVIDGFDTYMESE